MNIINFLKLNFKQPIKQKKSIMNLSNELNNMSVLEYNQLISQYLENKIYSRQEIINELQELRDIQDQEKDNKYHQKIMNKIHLYKEFYNQEKTTNEDIGVSKDDQSVLYQNKQDNYIDYNAESIFKKKRNKSVNSNLEKQENF